MLNNLKFQDIKKDKKLVLDIRLYKRINVFQLQLTAHSNNLRNYQYFISPLRR